MASAVCRWASLLVAGALSVAGSEPPKYAWVTMAYQSEDTPLWQTRGKRMEYQIYSLASSIRKHSQYPLVLLTDLNTFSDPEGFKADLEAMKVHLHHMEIIDLPEKLQVWKRWNVAWSKLQMFNMTQWDRLVWLDSDGILTQSMDYLFEKRGVWAQAEDWFCGGTPHGLCSGLVAFTPSKDTFQGLLDYAETLTRLKGADEQLIQDYLESIGEPARLLSPDQAAFGHCVNASGRLPHYVHKPEGYMDCLRALSLLTEEHRYANYSMKLCTGKVMGSAWRANLCEAGVSSDVLTSFCS